MKLGFKPVYRVKFNIQQLRNPAFGDDSTGTVGNHRKGRNIQILPNLVHHFFIGQIHDTYSEFPGHIFFGFRDLHPLGQLHPSHQISSGSDASHPGSHNVGDRHPERISDAKLQPVRFSDLNQGLCGPRRAVDGW
jgi:hypothetical protein